MDSLIKTILDNDLKTLKDYCETNVQKHIDARISEKRVDVLAKLNNTTSEKMAELMAVSV
jgi:hypothetical protein